MSGIFGIFRRDGRPVDPAELGAMESMLAHRGPDGRATWSDGSVGLGVQLFHTTPEARFETAPCRSVDGMISLVYDGRVDNRAELAAHLGIGSDELAATGDGQLMLAAWRRWGRGCVERIIGDFAVAIYDQPAGQLVLLRDRFGVRPLYYHLSDSLCAFATETKALVAIEEMPTELDEMRIATHLLRSFWENESTFYKAIRRLRPAHLVVVERERSSFECYWKLDPTRDVTLASDAEYAEAFRALLAEAVRARVRAPDPVAALLSGGLDSSAVACVARDLLRDEARPALHTISGVFDEVLQCDERPYIDAVTEAGGVVPHLVTVDRVSPLLEIDRVLWHMDEPFFTPHMSMEWLLFGAARDAGARVLLGGMDGDTVVGHGFAWQTELVLSGRLREFSNLVHQLGPVFGATPRELYWRRGVKPAVPVSLLRGWHALRRRRVSDTLFNRDFAHRIGLAGLERRHMRIPPRSVRQEHYGGLRAPIIAFMLESNNRSAAAQGIEPRHPFFDVRLAEFCLGLPTDQMIRGGTTRVIMRRALRDVIPQKVTDRLGKARLSPAFVHKLMSYERERLEQLVTAPSNIAEYVDPKRIHEFLESFDRGQGVRDGLELWVALMLSLGLDAMRSIRAAALQARFRHQTASAIR